MNLTGLHQTSLRIALAAGTLALATAPAMAAAPATSKAVPILSGGYVLTALENCLPDAGLRHETATLTFDPKSGKVKVDGYLMSGSPLSLVPLKSHGTYSNSSKTLTLASQTYNAVYGHRSQGIADYVSFIATESDGCGFQGWISRQ